MLKCLLSQDWVLTNVVKPKFGKNAHVPADWPETLYGRLKKNGFHTAWHCDALNTVVQRKLLKDYKAPAADASQKDPRDQWLQGEGSSSSFPTPEKLPIFTFWVCLNSLYSLKQSHLRVHSGSHRLGEPVAVRQGDQPSGEVLRIAPKGYKVCVSKQW